MNEPFTPLEMDMLKVLVKYGKLPENFLRNEEIKYKYKVMCQAGTKGWQAKRKLAEEYFTSFKNIENILYGNK